MKVVIVLAFAVLAAARPDDSKYDNLDVDELIKNERLLKAYALCFIGDGKCTPEGNEIKKSIPDAIQSSCGNCNDKQKAQISKFMKAMQSSLPQEWEVLNKMHNPDGKRTDELKKFLDSH